ncbi:MAG TPA: CHAD domain-containing protein [Aeromicrobium sp.]|nr:CHAD domain-containing protein [Aeromicrobium sp.]
MLEPFRRWLPAFLGTTPAEEASTFRIPADVDFETGFRQTVIEPATDAAQLLEKYELDPGRAIHQSRKDLKKLRAALRLLHEHADDEFAPAESIRLRDAGRLLAGARDADVKLATLASLRERGVLPISEQVLDDWTAALQRDQEELRHQLDNPHVPIGSSGAMVRSIDAVIEECQSVAGWPVEGLTLQSVRLALVRERARGIAAMGRVIEGGDDDAVHDFRKRMKDLWHHLDLLCDVMPSITPEHVQQAHDVSDLLGDHNDLAVLVADAARRPDVINAADLTAIKEAVLVIETDLRARAVEQARELYRSLI